MRARLQKYFPIFLIALLVQVLAPIGASWAAAAAASDPLSAAAICRGIGGAPDQPTEGSQHSEHNGCSICCLASASGSTDTPAPVAFAAPYREVARVVWQDQTLDLSALRVGSNAQARAPPFSS
jgi:hypothetical protein